MSLEARFLELLPTINRFADELGRRRGLVGADAEDFASLVRARFVESNYSPLAQFRGDSSMETYLAVVIRSWLNDVLIARDGRWRPSAVALRLGPVAVHLERLLSKGHRSVDEAIAELVSGADHPYTERELREIARQLPRRQPLRMVRVATDQAAELPAPSSTTADAALDGVEQAVERERVTGILRAALSVLSPEDRMIVTMRFLDGKSVAEIARVLQLEQKPLYRRLERSLTTLRRHLEHQGVSPDIVRKIVEARE